MPRPNRLDLVDCSNKYLAILLKKKRPWALEALNGPSTRQCCRFTRLLGLPFISKVTTFHVGDAPFVQDAE